MKHYKGLVTTSTAVAVVVLLTTGATLKPNSRELAPLATPEGITSQPIGTAAGYSLSKYTANKLPREKIVFADAEGMTLYTYDADAPNKPTCTGECAKSWRPALAPQNPKLAAGWTVIARADGTRQWALHNKPLYTFVEDEDIGSVGGSSPRRFARGPLIQPRGIPSKSIPADKPLPDGWHAAMMYPALSDNIPSGISIRDVEDAMALAFIDDRTERTLYAFEGDAKAAEKACSNLTCRNTWTPFSAPRLAIGSGDFAIASRDDGITQWTYKGRALFMNAKDVQFNDANGIGTDERFQVAAHARYFVPANVRTQSTHRLGRVLSTVNGQTLYRRNSYIMQTGGGHSLRRGDTVRPAVGRDLGIDPHCTQECEKWRPFLAPVGAVPSGDWTLYERPDGSQQWASRGYALWTYDGDKSPGDINGTDTYDLAISHDDKTVLDIGTPYDGAWALFWVAAFP